MSSIFQDTINGADQWVGPPKAVGGHMNGPVIVAVIGTWSGTVTIKVKLDGSSEWITVRTLTENEEIPEPSLPYNTMITVGFDTGDYVSGTANVSVYPT